MQLWNVLEGGDRSDGNNSTLGVVDMKRDDGKRKRVKDVFLHTLAIFLCVSILILFIIPACLYPSDHTHIHTHTDETNESYPAFFCPAFANFICKWKVYFYFFAASFCSWGMAAHCVFGSGSGGVMRALRVCVCSRSPDEAALAWGSLSACSSSMPVPSFSARRDHLFH